MNQPTSKRFLGITVMSPFFQNEGVENVLTNVVERAGASAVACNTSVAAPSAEGQGAWQPPDDAGASVRAFERPLWGKAGLWLRSGPGHRPNPAFFHNSPYQPREPNDLTDSDGAIIEQFIVAAKARGLAVYIQTSATQPPGLRVEDMPQLPDGRVPDGRMAYTGSLASPSIRRYNRAWVQDVFARYPMIDGIRPDWPEYPCYTLDEVFQDFGPHAQHWAEQHGFDFERMRHDVGQFYRYLHGSLTNDDLRDIAGPSRGTFTILRLLGQHPGVAEWLRFKAALSNDLLGDWRAAITEHGGAAKELSANAFMPPFSTLTGFDFAGAAAVCESIAPKLYTMHWSLIIQFWGEALLAVNPGLNEHLLVQAMLHLLDIDEERDSPRIADYGYPEPDEPHPISVEAQQRKIQQAMHAAAGRAKIYPIVHGYGPLDDFRRRLQLVADSAADGVWINRYGYLSDEKLDAIGEIWQ